MNLTDQETPAPALDPHSDEFVINTFEDALAWFRAQNPNMETNRPQDLDWQAIKAQGPTLLVSIVLDCSMSLTWCLPGQGSVVSDRLLVECRKERIFVPDVWHIEMANILGLKYRDGNLSQHDLNQALVLLGKLPIETSSLVPTASIRANLERVARFGIAAYDAIYVDLALATGSRLASFDRSMVRAAQRAGLSLITKE